jgi:hypothetical protein
MTALQVARTAAASSGTRLAALGQKIESLGRLYAGSGRWRLFPIMQWIKRTLLHNA